MATDSDPAVQAATLVEQPDTYETLAAAYDDELQFYGALRNNAQRSLDTFEEYVALRRVFLERGPTDAIRRRIEDRLDRSLKNMVLGTSARGRAYAVDTLAELEDRRQAFATLDVTVPSLSTVVRTTVEHLYDDTPDTAAVRDTCESLLAATPTGEREAVAYVARVRLVESLLAADDPAARLETETERYLETTAPPDAGAGMTAAECAAAAAELGFADEDKRRLQEAALHAAPSAARLSEHLYLTAADVVETYRHGGEGVTRGEFIVARRQLAVVERIGPASWPADRRAYAESYRHLADAIEAGGARWLSTRASGPPPEWWTVAEAYVRAARAVFDVDLVRAVKYLSKAVRHAAHATDEWATRRQLHGSAQAMLDRIDPAAVRDDGRSRSPADVAEAVDGTRAVHRCRESEATAHLAFEAAAYADVPAAADRARAAAEETPQRHIQFRSLDTIEALAAARRAERRGEYETALERYRRIDPDERHLEVGVDCHRQLCAIKRAVDAGDHDEALRLAHEEFRPGSAVVVATEASCGVVPEAADDLAAGLTDQLLSVDAEAIAALPAVLRLLRAGGETTALVRGQAAACLRAL